MHIIFLIFFWVHFVVYLFIILLIAQTSFASDKFIDARVLSQSTYPLAAVNFLQQQLGDKPTNIFNEFGWGGYLIWRLPQAKVYFDGRGTATWTYPGTNEPMLKHYRELKFLPGGLAEIEKSPAEWIILERSYSGYSTTPDTFNRLMFGEDNLQKVLDNSAPPLIVDLEKSSNWKKVYEDYLATIWQRKS